MWQEGNDGSTQTIGNYESADHPWLDHGQLRRNRRAPSREAGLGVELPGSGDGQESGGDAGTTRRASTPLMWALIVAAVFALAAAFFRGGMR